MENEIIVVDYHSLAGVLNIPTHSYDIGATGCYINLEDPQGMEDLLHSDKISSKSKIGQKPIEILRYYSKRGVLCRVLLSDVEESKEYFEKAVNTRRNPSYTKNMVFEEITPENRQTLNTIMTLPISWNRVEGILRKKDFAALCNSYRLSSISGLKDPIYTVAKAHLAVVSMFQSYWEDAILARVTKRAQKLEKTKWFEEEFSMEQLLEELKKI